MVFLESKNHQCTYICIWDATKSIKVWNLRGPMLTTFAYTLKLPPTYIHTTHMHVLVSSDIFKNTSLSRTKHVCTNACCKKRYYGLMSNSNSPKSEIGILSFLDLCICTYVYIYIYMDICNMSNWNSTKNRGTKQIQYRSNYVVGEHKGLTHIGKWPTSWNNKDKYVHTCGPFYPLLGCKVFVRGKWVLYFCSTSSYSTLCTNRDGPNNSLQPGGGQ
jgi:hypothetical protein